MTKKYAFWSDLLFNNPSTVFVLTSTVLWQAFRNRPFYSCALSYLAMNASEAGGDLALIETSLLFSCK